MKVLSALLMVFSVFLIIRKFKMIDTYIFGYSYHKTTTIDRIKKFQLICDTFCASYYTIICLICSYCCFLCLSNVLDINLKNYNVINVIILLFIFCITTIFIIIKKFVYEKQGVTDFYNKMVEYRSKQIVVTEENDYEVSFLRSYRELNNINVYIYIWFLISVVLFVTL